jgi:hypothetical protein
MSISSSQVTTSSTLEQFRVQFNNLVTDVDGLENGTSNFAFITVAEDGNITFEGATNDGNQTTLTVADPTADRTVTIPDATGTLMMAGSTLEGSNSSLLLGDSGTPDEARVRFGDASDMDIYHDGTDSFIDNKTGALKLATNTSGIAVTIGHTTSETTVADNLNVVGSLSLGGTTSSTSGNVVIAPASNILEVQGDGSSIVGQLQLNCHVNSHGQIIASQPHSEAATNILTLPGGTTIGNSNATLVSDTGTQTLTNKTIGLTNNTINGTTAEFNTALSDGSFATLAGTETLTNKTIDFSNNTIIGAASTGLATAMAIAL